MDPSSLPKEIISTIVFYLPPREVAALILTCKAFAFISSLPCWQQLAVAIRIIKIERQEKGFKVSFSPIDPPSPAVTFDGYVALLEKNNYIVTTRSQKYFSSLHCLELAIELKNEKMLRYYCKKVERNPIYLDQALTSAIKRWEEAVKILVEELTLPPPKNITAVPSQKIYTWMMEHWEEKYSAGLATMAARIGDEKYIIKHLESIRRGFTKDAIVGAARGFSHDSIAMMIDPSNNTMEHLLTRAFAYTPTASDIVGLQKNLDENKPNSLYGLAIRSCRIDILAALVSAGVKAYQEYIGRYRNVSTAVGNEEIATLLAKVPFQ